MRNSASTNSFFGGNSSSGSSSSSSSAPSDRRNAPPPTIGPRGRRRRSRSIDLYMEPIPEDEPLFWPLWSRIRRKLVKNTDNLLLFLLFYKMSMLMVLAMPKEYFFHVKESILTWAATSNGLRVYMRYLTWPIALYVLGVTVHARLSPNSEPLRAQRQFLLSTFNLLLLFIVHRFYELFRGDATPLLDLEQRALDRDVIDFTPPSLASLGVVTKPLRTLSQPVLVDAHNIPEPADKILFVRCSWGGGGGGLWRRVRVRG
jgi:hypothetical protein